MFPLNSADTGQTQRSGSVRLPLLPQLVFLQTLKSKSQREVTLTQLCFQPLPAPDPKEPAPKLRGHSAYGSAVGYFFATTLKTLRALSVSWQNLMCGFFP